MRHKQIIAFVFLCLLSVASIAQEQTTISYSLEEAKTYAAEHAYQQKLAALDVEKAKNKVNETISIGLPQVSASLSYLNNIEIPSTVIPGDFIPNGKPGELVAIRFGSEQSMDASITANQLIFDGSYLVGLQATKVYLELSKNDKEKSLIELKKLVTQAYGNVLVAEKNLEILKKNQKSLDVIAFETEEIYKNGLIEEQDKDQAKLNYQRITNQYEDAGRQLELAKNQLKFIMGLPVNSNIVLSDNLEKITETSMDADFAHKELIIDNHIEYKSILTQEKATSLLTRQQKSVYLPKLTGFYTYQQNSFENEFNFYGDAVWLSGQFFGINLSVPIFTSFGNKNRVQQAKIDHEKVKIAKLQIEQNLKIQAENAKSAYMFALNQYETNNENLVLAESIYDKVKEKYDEGMNSSLDLTTANNQLLTAQQSYIQASFQLIDSKVKLDQALNNL